MKKALRDYANKGNQFAYLFDCMYSSSYIADGVFTINGTEQTPENDKLLLGQIYAECKRVQKGDNRKPSLVQVVRDQLQGLAGWCEVDYWNDEIIKIGRSWGYCKTTRQADSFVNDWFAVHAYNIIRMFRYYGISEY